MSRARVAVVFALVASAIGLGGPAWAQPDDPSGVVRPEEGQIVRLYAAALHRAPEPNGFAFWVNQLIEGEGLRVVARYFVNSPEFEARFDADSDDEFVELVYRNVFHRGPDIDGRHYWLGRLATGLGRETMVLYFAESDEFAEQTGTSLPALEPFVGEVANVNESSLGPSWRSGCPVTPTDLRVLSVSHVGYEGGAEVGQLVVHAGVAAEVVQVFAQLYQARYPIERMQTIDNFGGDDDASMAANNTSAFNCRAVTGGTGWSRHAFGRAIDINPRQNPYRRGSVVLPPEGQDYLDRTQYHRGMIREGDVVTRAFDGIGWQWGGRWVTLVDYQHFDLR